MKYKGIIFDLDGVICSTDHYHYLAWKALADRLGAYFDETINNRLRGVSRMAILEIVLERYDGTLTEEEKLAAAEEKNNTYRELLKQMSPADLSNEVKTTLDALRAKGLLLGIGSSSKNTKFILSRIGLGDYFDKISDGTLSEDLDVLDTWLRDYSVQIMIQLVVKIIVTEALFIKRKIV